MPDNSSAKEQWEYNLTNHKPTEDAIRKIEGLRSAAKAMSAAIIDLVPQGREQSLALTKNEEMLFHAVSGLVRTENEDKTIEEK